MVWFFLILGILDKKRKPDSSNSVSTGEQVKKQRVSTGEKVTAAKGIPVNSVTATGVKILPRYKANHSDNKSDQPIQRGRPPKFNKADMEKENIHSPPQSGTFWVDVIHQKHPAFSPVVTDQTKWHVLTFLRDSYGKIDDSLVDIDNLLIPRNLFDGYLESFENAFIPALTRYNQ
jgi:hypothetical protein